MRAHWQRTLLFFFSHIALVYAFVLNASNIRTMEKEREGWSYYIKTEPSQPFQHLGKLHLITYHFHKLCCAKWPFELVCMVCSFPQVSSQMLKSAFSGITWWRWTCHISTCCYFALLGKTRSELWVSSWNVFVSFPYSTPYLVLAIRWTARKIQSWLTSIFTRQLLKSMVRRSGKVCAQAHMQNLLTALYYFVLCRSLFGAMSGMNLGTELFISAPQSTHWSLSPDLISLRPLLLVAFEPGNYLGTSNWLIGLGGPHVTSILDGFEHTQQSIKYSPKHRTRY